MSLFNSLLRFEWGNPKTNMSIFEAMKGYSPYDNVRKMQYPHMLLTAGKKDSRVSYVEPSKMVAKVREYCRCPDKMILLNINEWGHFADGSLNLQEQATIFSFIMQSLAT